MGWWITGSVLLIVSVILQIVRHFQQKKLGVMQSTETATVAMLTSLADSMTEGVGKGNLRYHTEVKGKVVCDEPLTSELTGTACVYYRMSVERQFEERYTDRDSSGRPVQKTRRRTETIASNIRSVPFQVDDGSGRITVNPEDAEVIAGKVLSRFEPGANPGMGSFRLGSFSFDFSLAGSASNTLGYLFEESLIPLDAPLYVLGEAADPNGRLEIRRPEDGGKFIVSVKSEEELQRQARAKMRGLLIAALITGVLGIILLLVGALR